MGVGTAARAAGAAFTAGLSNLKAVVKSAVSTSDTLSEAAATGLTKAKNTLSEGLETAGENIENIRSAFKQFEFDIDALDGVTGMTQVDKAFFKSYKAVLSTSFSAIEAASAAVDEAADAAGTAAKKGVMGRLGDVANSPTGQTILKTGGVFGGLYFISKMDEDIEEDRAACISACLPSNWDEYQEDATAPVTYTTSAELAELGLTNSAPVCTSSKLTDPGCFEYCNNACIALNPTFLSKYTAPFTQAVEDAAEAAGVVVKDVAGGAGGIMSGFLSGLGIPLAIAAGIIVLILIVMNG